MLIAEWGEKRSTALAFDISVFCSSPVKRVCQDKEHAQGRNSSGVD